MARAPGGRSRDVRDDGAPRPRAQRHAPLRAAVGLPGGVGRRPRPRRARGLDAAGPAPARRRAAFELTVDSIMRGPDLVGYPPTACAGPAIPQRLYFDWRKPGEENPSTYVVGRDGGGAAASSRRRRRANAPPDERAPPATARRREWTRRHRRSRRRRARRHRPGRYGGRRRAGRSRGPPAASRTRAGRATTRTSPRPRRQPLRSSPVDRRARRRARRRSSPTSGRRSRAEPTLTDSQKFLQATKKRSSSASSASTKAATRRRTSEKAEERTSCRRFELQERQIGRRT